MLKAPSLNPIQNITNIVKHAQNVSDLVTVSKGKSNYPVSVSKTLSRYGKNRIVRIILNRKPLATRVNTLLNVFQDLNI